MNLVGSDNCVRWNTSDEATGLHVDVVADDTVVHNQKLSVWNEFNLSWLALLQGQKENTEQEITVNQNPADVDHLISARFLERMGTELVRLCDNIERHGLVDYEMGVAEEEIISGKRSTLHLPHTLALSSNR